MLDQKIIRYKLINQAISEAALKAMERDLWYVISELVVLALFGGSAVPSCQRYALAQAMLDANPKDVPSRPSKRFGSGFGKPVSQKVTETTTLADLVNDDSWWTVEFL